MMGKAQHQENDLVAFKESLSRQLNELGVIKALKAHIHGQVLKELPQNAPALPGSMSQHKAPSVFAAVINSLIAEYLAVCGMGSTLSTFQTESGLQATRLSGGHILKLLNVKPGTCIGEALAIQGVNAQNPSGPHGLAVALLEAIAMTSLPEKQSKIQSMTDYQATIGQRNTGVGRTTQTGLGEVNNLDGAQDDVIRDLRKRLSRARMNAENAYRSAATHRRSAEDANLALDEALDLQAECMNALEDLRSRFAASQRTVGHLSRELIAAQLKQQSSLDHVLSAPAALEAQEALLSRHQTAQRIERKQEALQRRMLELKRCISRQRAAAARRAAATSPLPRLPAAAAESSASASCTSGQQMMQPRTAEAEAGCAISERGHIAPQHDTSASSVSATEDGNSLRSSSSTIGNGAQRSATVIAAAPDISQDTSSRGTPKAPVVTVPSPVRPDVHMAAAPPPGAGSATIQPLASSVQHAVPTLGTGALGLDRTVAGILDLDTDGPTNASNGLNSHGEQAAAIEVSRSAPAGDSMTGCAAESPPSCSTAGEQSSSSHAAAQPEWGDTIQVFSTHAADQEAASAAEDPGSGDAGFDTEQEDALLAALGIDGDSDASLEEECYSDDQEIDVCAEA
ncbi:probable oral-facial-digital syndrome 1 protein homolog at N-terminal half [Coccomyxa sp. Obi]|nr:probable oral-facial-digital syndrome 1 protein homolog at N-terminal half [Coccomyxa sp. Obi]